MTGLSDRERRLIAVLILVAVIAFAWLAVLSPIINGFQARAAERERLALVQASNQRLIDNIARLRRQAEAQKADNARFHIIAATPEAAAEQIKDRLSALLTAGGGEVRAMQDIEAGEGRVELRIEARVGEGALVALLERLRNAEPLLIVTALSVAAPGADPAAQSSQTRQLDVRIDVASSHSPA
jgi:type II secretory pathway component PulM